MWIRSQNEKILMNCDRINIHENFICALTSNGLSVDIGNYETNERAMEVLDLIHYNNDFIETRDYTFQMPKE